MSLEQMKGGKGIEALFFYLKFRLKREKQKFDSQKFATRGCFFGYLENLNKVNRKTKKRGNWKTKLYDTSARTFSFLCLQNR